MTSKDEIKGKLEEGLGKATGDEELEDRGQADQARGKAKEAVGAAKDAAERAKDAVDR